MPTHKEGLLLQPGEPVSIFSKGCSQLDGHVGNWNQENSAFILLVVCTLDQALGPGADSGKGDIFRVSVFSNPLFMTREWDQYVTTLHRGDWQVPAF